MENANMPAHVQEPDSCQIGSYHMYDTQEEIFGKGISSNFNHRKVQIYDKTGAARQYREGVEWTKATLLGSGAYSCCYQARDVLTGTIMAVKQISNLKDIKNLTKTGHDDKYDNVNPGGIFNWIF